MTKPNGAFDAAFDECLGQIVRKTETGFDFSSIGDLFNDCDRFDLAMFLPMFDSGEDHEALHQKVNVSMTLRDLIALALDLDELKKLRAFQEKHYQAGVAYQESTDRQDKKLAKFAADVGLTTDGKRRSKINAFYVFVDYLGAINGVGCEKMSKADALAMVAKKHGIQSPEAVVSHLKRYLKDSKQKFPGILP